MSTIVQVEHQHFNTKTILIHIGRQQQLLDEFSVVRCFEGFVEPYLADAGLIGRTTRHTIEVVNGKAEFTISIGNHVFCARTFFF